MRGSRDISRDYFIIKWSGKSYQIKVYIIFIKVIIITKLIIWVAYWFKIITINKIIILLIIESRLFLFWIIIIKKTNKRNWINLKYIRK